MARRDFGDFVGGTPTPRRSVWGGVMEVGDAKFGKKFGFCCDNPHGDGLLGRFHIRHA